MWRPPWEYFRISSTDSKVKTTCSALQTVNTGNDNPLGSFEEKTLLGTENVFYQDGGIDWLNVTTSLVLDDHIVQLSSVIYDPT